MVTLQELIMSIQVPSDIEILQEAAEILLKYLGPAKSARFWSIWQRSHHDYQVRQNVESDQTDIKQLFEAIIEYQTHQVENDAPGHDAEAHSAHTPWRPSLFGSVKAGDITETMIEDAKHELFRLLPDL